MKKKPRLNKRTLKNLKLKLKQLSDRKVAPTVLGDAIVEKTSNGQSCI